MGQSLSQEAAKKPDVLGNVERRMRDKLECTKAKLYIDALNDECVAIVCAVAKFDGMLYIEDAGEKAKAKTEEATERSLLEEEITNIIRRYLHTEPEGADNKLIELVTKVVETLLSRKQGKHEAHHYQVVLANKGVIRFDYFICLEILTGGEVTDGKAAVLEATTGVNAALSYYGQVGLMNVAAAKPQVLMYELRRATDDKHHKKIGEELKKLKTKISSVEDVGNFLMGQLTVSQNDEQPFKMPKNPGDGSGQDGSSSG